MAFESPKLDAVGALLRARTKDDHGNELGTFSKETRPDDKQVETLIKKAQAVVFSRTGSAFDEAFNEGVSEMIAVRAAMFVELSYFPEQIKTEQSPYKMLKELYDDGMEALIEDMGGTGKSVGGETLMPSHAGPTEPLIKRDMRW